MEQVSSAPRALITKMQRVVTTLTLGPTEQRTPCQELVRSYPSVTCLRILTRLASQKHLSDIIQEFYDRSNSGLS